MTIQDQPKEIHVIIMSQGEKSDICAIVMIQDQLKDDQSIAQIPADVYSLQFK